MNPKIRIVGGTYRSRNLALPPLDASVRPTQEIVRKAVFSALGENVSGTVLDLFAGSGAYGFEALSRGADKAYFNDLNKKCADAVKKSAQTLGCSGKTVITNLDYRIALERYARLGVKFDYVFLDPPYKEEINAEIVSRMEELSLLSGTAVLVLEQEEEVRPIEGYSFRSYAYSYKKVGIYRRIKA